MTAARCFVLRSNRNPVSGARVSVVWNQGKHVAVAGRAISDAHGYARIEVDRRIAAMSKGELHLALEGSDQPPILIADQIRGDDSVAILIDDDVPDTPAGQFNSRPDPQDWRLSPGSVGVSPTPVIGEDGCTVLLPSELSVRDYDFLQVRRGDPKLTADAEGIGAVRHGVVLQYLQEWIPAGHGLGQILYTLALAPCEAVKIGMIDWQRQSTVKRTEGQSVVENLVNNVVRSATTTETVDMAKNRWKKTETDSFSFGVTLPLFQGAGVSLGIGNETTTENENETVKGETVKEIDDEVGRAATYVRDSASTVVVEATQAEQERLQTRHVRNHNHAHAMTVLYFEVLRHYVVRTRFVREIPVLLVPYEVFCFDACLASCHRTLLEAALLDPTLRGAFEDIEHLAVEPPPPPAPSPADTDDVEAPPPPSPVYRIKIEVGTSSKTTSQVGQTKLHIQVKTKQATFEWLGAMDTPSVGERGEVVLDPLLASITGSAPELLADDISSIHVKLDGTGLTNWQPSGVRVLVQPVEDDHFTHLVEHLQMDVGEASPTTPDWFNLFANGSIGDFPTVDPGEQPGFGVSFDGPPDLPPTERPTEDEDRDDCPPCRAIATGRAIRLLDHLNCHRVYYSKMLWLTEDPDARAIRFDVPYVSGKLVDHIVNRPLAVLGNYVAFQKHGAFIEPSDDPPLVERLVSLPTAGVFAEAKLSDCSAAEVIDDTRFWKWHEAPCPGDAPAFTEFGDRGRADDQVPTPTTVEPVLSIGEGGEDGDGSDSEDVSAIAKILETLGDKASGGDGEGDGKSAATQVIEALVAATKDKKGVLDDVVDELIKEWKKNEKDGKAKDGDKPKEGDDDKNEDGDKEDGNDDDGTVVV